MFSELRLYKIIAHCLLWIQILTPGLSLLPTVARANEPTYLQSTVQGLDSLIVEGRVEAEVAPQPTAQAQILPVKPEAMTSSTEYFQLQPPHEKEAPILNGLPDLSLPSGTPVEKDTVPKNQADNKADTQDNVFLSGASQFGSIMSGDNRSDAAVNYARSLGEGLINQQINDWLNQYGNAKISVGTQQKLSGDILIPVYETDENLIFTQVGTRTNEDRNTANLGVGYRHYLSDWMLGINTFYDYDYTGNNKRIGVGGEAWADYLKLAANGYIRQTNWHQSKLDSMEDYDERPANGFDLRANAYLPSWPSLGGSLKYEQYFGKGVSVDDSASPDSLKDNPVVVTAGLDYTPFPLITLSAKRSIGDSNETSVGLDLNYRFGAPWYQQINPDTVGLMRSLAGSKYDFVDRNYDIVMQYRKQDLLHIELPANTVAQAAETVPVVLAVPRAKYGLKSVEWTVDPDLTVRGGHYKIISSTELAVTLPPYDFSRDKKLAQNYKISAVALDNHDNQSNTTETVISVIPSENVVGALVISPDSQSLIANNEDFYTITALVVDGKGVPLANQILTFSLDGLMNSTGHAGTSISAQDGSQTDSRQIKVTTQSNGKSVVMVRSTVAGQGQITAKMDNGNFSTSKISFIGDRATAAVRQVLLNDSVNYKTADPKNNFTYTGQVQDRNGNPIPDAQVTWNKDAQEVTLSGTTSMTDIDGNATIKLLSGTRAVSNITVSASSDSQQTALEADQKVSFIAGDIDPAKSTFSASPTEITANGQTASVLTLNMMDTNTNPISGLAASLRVGVSGVNNAKATIFTEGKAGSYTSNFSGTGAGIATLTAISGSKAASVQTPVVKLLPDASTAQITQENLVVNPDGSPADGETANTVTATVTDSNGNLVQGAAVNFTVGGSAILSKSSAVSDANGVVSTTVSSKKAGSFDVGAVVRGNVTTGKTRFVADIGTAHVASVTLSGDETSKFANGTDGFIYNVKVVDANDNIVEGVTVTAAKDHNEGVLTVSNGGMTDVSGEMLMTMTSTKAVTGVGVSAKVGTTASVPADKTVSFVADSSTAQVSSLKVTADNAVADGKATDSVTVIVQDANQNPVLNTVIRIVADGGAQTGATVTSDANGSAVATLTSKIAGPSTVVASLNGSSQTGKVTFVADASTAKVTSLVVTTDGAIANGVATDSVTVLVQDTNQNPVPNSQVSLVADNGAKISTTTMTGTDGRAIATLTSEIAGASTVTASLNGSNQTGKVNFVADTSTAVVASLVVTKDGAVANGTATDSVTVTVWDINSNPVPNAQVSLTASNSAQISSTATTGANGSVVITLTNKVAESSTVTASLNNTSQTGTVSFVADGATAKVESLIVTTDGAVANGSATNGVKVIVLDANNNPVPNSAVSLAADHGAKMGATVTTGTDGSALATLTSLVAGPSNITASLNGSSQNKAVIFVADASTAVVSNLTVTADDAVANGIASNGMKVTVLDANQNPVPNVQISLVADNSATIARTVTTGVDGSADATLTSLVAGASNVTASLNGSSQQKTVTFKADASTATLTSLIVSADGAVADGEATNSVTLTVLDASHNPVPGAIVNLGAENGAKIGAVATTGADGRAVATLTSLVAGASNVTASLNGSSQQVTVTFVADASTAVVTNLTVTVDGAVADGVAANGVRVVVQDASHNPVPDALVSLTANNGAKIAGAVTTGTDGSAVIALTSLKSGLSAVTASLNGSNQSATVTFTPDASTAQIVTANLVISPDGAVANGVASNGVSAKITDANGNFVPGMTVSFSVNSTATINVVKGTSDENGAVMATLTSLKAGSFTVTATVDKTGKSSSGTTSFVPDVSTAKVASIVVTTDGAVADGVATNGVTVVVLDANQNPVPNSQVSLTASNTAKIIAKVTTGTDGSAKATLSSLKAGTSTVTASLNGSSQNAPVIFVGDANTAEIVKSNLVIDPDAATADGNATNGVTATVTDANGNRVPNMAVSFTVSTGATITALKGTSDAKGEVLATVTSLRAASYTVTATVDKTGSQASGTTTFVADATTAQVVSLGVMTDRSAADGNAANVVRVMVQDANDNPVSNQLVSLTADNSAQIIATVTTGADGRAVANVTSLLAGPSKVTASLNNSVKDTTVTFIGDDKTAQIVAADLLISQDGAVADGKAINGVTAKVTDTNGNLVIGAAVSFSVSTGATITAIKGTSDDKGEVTAKVTSLKAASYTVTAKVDKTSKTASGTTTFVADPATGLVSSLMVITDDVVADGIANNRVKVTVRDVNQNLLPNAVVSLSATNSAQIVATVTTAADGNAEATLNSVVSGQTTVTASINQSKLDAVVQFAAGTAVAETSSLSMDRTSYTADADMKVTATLKDVHSNAVTGQAAALKDDVVTVPNAAVKPGSNWVEDSMASGTYSRTYVAQIAGTALKSTLSLLGWSQQSSEYSITASLPVGEQSEFVLAPVSIVADSTAASTLTLTARDVYGNTVSDIAQTLSFAVTDATGKAPAAGKINIGAVTDSGNGVYKANLTGILAGDYTVAPLYNSSALGSLNAPVTLISGQAAAGQSLLAVSKSRVIANGDDSAIVKLTVYDAQKNPVSGLEGSLAFVSVDSVGQPAGSAVSFGNVKRGDNAGEYTATVKSNTIGTYKIGVKFNDEQFGSISVDLSMFDYSFKLNSMNQAIVVDAKYQFIVQAVTSDTAQSENVIPGVAWESSNKSIATIDSTGTALGKSNGAVTINAVGIYKGYPYNIDGQLKVEGQVISPDYGHPAPGDITNQYLIEPPSYSIAMRCGAIVDAMGTSESITGGTGGQSLVINDLNNVKSIDITTGTWHSEASAVTQLKYNMQDNTSRTCGKGTDGTTDVVTQRFTVEDDQVLQGYKVSGAHYIHAVQFITIPK